MAVVSRIATIKFDNSLGSTKTWTATAAVQDTAAGSSVVVTIDRVNVGALAPDDTDTLTLRYVDDGGNIIRSVTLNNTTFPQTDTFFFTANGASGGGNRCGTIEIKLQATKTTGGPTNTYDVETDGSPNTPPSTFTTTQLDRGWIRGTTTLVESISNISLGGGKSTPAEYDESLFVRLTAGDTSYIARALSVSISNTTPSLSGNTNSTTAAQRDVTFSGVVDNRFPASVQTAAVSETVPNATLTGLPDFTFSSVTDDSISVDPRLTCTHLLQLDDNSFGTPPMSKNSAAGQRLTSQIGYISTNLRAARGTLTGNAITEGKNTNSTGTAINIHTSLQDQAQAVTAITQDGDLGTRGGEAGWMGFMQWTSALPGGTWNKTVTINSPSDITGASYLLNSTVSYTLLAIDPAIKLAFNASVDSSNLGDHFSPGMALVVEASLFNRVTNQAVAPDSSPAPTCSILRYNQTTQKKQYLKTDYTWADLTGGTADTFALTVSPNDANTYARTFTAAQTSTANGWDNSRLEVISTVYRGGTPYGDVIPVPVTGTNNKHSGYSYDPVGDGFK